MMLSYMQGSDGEDVLAVVLTPYDVSVILVDHGEIKLEQIPEAKRWHGLTIWITGPAGGDAMLRAAVEARDGGAEVRFRGRPGHPDE